MMPKITMYLLIVIPFLPWAGKYYGHLFGFFLCVCVCMYVFLFLSFFFWGGGLMSFFFYFVVFVVVVARTRTIHTFFVEGIAYV